MLKLILTLLPFLSNVGNTGTGRRLKTNKNNGGISRTLTTLPAHYWVIGFLFVLCIVFWGKIKIFASKMARQNSKEQDVSKFAGKIDTVSKINIQQLAEIAYNSIWGKYLWEDETRFVETLLQVPKAEMPRMMIAYARVKKKGRNLHTDALRYLNNKEYNKIRHLFA